MWLLLSPLVFLVIVFFVGMYMSANDVPQEIVWKGRIRMRVKYRYGVRTLHLIGNDRWADEAGHVIDEGVLQKLEREFYGRRRKETNIDG